MSNNLNDKEILMVGVGYMGKEYHKVLSAMGIRYTAVGRSKESVEEFEKVTGHKAYSGGIDNYIEKYGMSFDTAILAVQAGYASDCAIMLLKSGIKRLLVEKPCGLSREQMDCIIKEAEKNDAKVIVAYNRRQYVSVMAAEKIIEEDGGILSAKFDFTEKGFKDDESIEGLLIGNSTHVIDTFFLLAGLPEKISSYVNIIQDKKMRVEFAGAGVTEKGVLFSYSANWKAPGRWNIEVMTAYHRLIFSPMEKLQIQELGTFAITEPEIDYTIDTTYKPGIYRQVELFLSDIENPRLLTIQQQREHLEYYLLISRGLSRN